MKAKHQATYTLEALQHGFGFNDDDLAANQNGIITEAQKARVKARIGGDNRFLWIAAAIMGIVAIAILADGVSQSDTFRIGASIVLMIFAVMAAATAYRRGQGIVAELEAGIAEHVQGEIKLRYSGKRPESGVRTVRVEDTRLYHLSKEEYFALQNGSRYGFYYTPQTHYILSVYPVDGD